MKEITHDASMCILGKWAYVSDIVFGIDRIPLDLCYASGGLSLYADI